MEITVRKAKVDELEWINQKYDEVDFVHSNNDELIVIAEIDGIRAGIGRLIQIDEEHAELSGIYVFEEFRGKGVSRQIVSALMKNKGSFNHIYCLPFEHLKLLYASFGFERTAPDDGIPKKILDKYQWCQEQYPHPVLLLVWQRDQ